MQSKQMKVCNMGMFDNNRHFWMGELKGFLNFYPQFEHSHIQDFYTILFINNADGEIIIDNEKIEIESQKIIIIKPRCISKIDINNQAVGKIICFTEDFFSLRYNNNVLLQFSFLQRDARPSLALESVNQKALDIILDLLLNEFRLVRKESKKIIRSYLNIILFELDRLVIPSFLGSSKNANQEKVHAFELLIDKHFQTKKFPSEYSDLLHISTNYLNKICKKETGYTSGELIRNRLIIEAKRLLHYTNNTINEIASELGFETTSYFITFFKKEMKMSPEMYRKSESMLND